MVNSCLWGLCLEIDGRVGQGTSWVMKADKEAGLGGGEHSIPQRQKLPSDHCPTQVLSWLLFIANMKSHCQTLSQA